MVTTTSMGSQNKCQEFRGDDDDDDDGGVGMISCEAYLELIYSWSLMAIDPDED